MRYNIFKIILMLFFLVQASNAFGVGVRLRVLLDVGGSSTAEGFGDEPLLTSESGLAVIFPVVQDTSLEVGYTYFSAYIEEEATTATTSDNTTLAITQTNTGQFQAHLLELGVDYRGFKLTSQNSLLFNLAFKVPLGGQGGIEANTKTISGNSYNSTSDSASTTSVGGLGVFLGVGITHNRFESLLYYQQSAFAYDLQVEREGKTEDVTLNITSFGIGIGYVF